MKKKKKIALGICLLAGVLLTGCTSRPDGQGSTAAAAESSAPYSGSGAPEKNAADVSDGTEAEDAAKEGQAALPDGAYTADFDTDSSMFHVSEASNGKGLLTVADGKMTIHISLSSKNIVNLYPGLAEDAQKEGAKLLQPTLDTVTYSDGMTEEVYGFDVPFPELGEEFDLALIGTKGKWYDHKVSVSNPEKTPGEGTDGATAQLEDGTYSVELGFDGGSGKASVLSPAKLRVSEGKATAKIQWSSPNYDYMIVNGETYYPVSTEGNSVFEIPVEAFDVPVEVIGDTVAMSAPHEIEYTLTFYSDTIKSEK